MPTFTDTIAADANLTTATSATVVGTLSAADVAGTYTGVVYQDTNINGSVDPGEPSAYVSFTTAGAPASITLTPATSSKAAAALDTFTVTLLDAAGTKTQAATGEFFSIVADPSSAASQQRPECRSPVLRGPRGAPPHPPLHLRAGHGRRHSPGADCLGQRFPPLYRVRPEETGPACRHVCPCRPSSS